MNIINQILIKLDDEIDDAVLNFEDNCFHSFRFNYVCNVEVEDIKNEKIINKEIRGDGEKKACRNNIGSREKF